MKADQRYGMVMTITIFLTAASRQHWHRPPTYRSLPLSHIVPPKENNMNDFAISLVPHSSELGVLVEQAARFLEAAEVLQLLLCWLLQSARVGVVQKCLDGNFDRGSLGIGSGLNRFWQIDRRRFLGIFELIDEFLRLLPTARLRAAPDEFPRLGNSLNPFGASTASIGRILLLARRIVTSIDGQHMGLSTGSAGPAPQQALGGPVVRLLYDCFCPSVNY
jgi:hypothetical protein